MFCTYDLGDQWEHRLVLEDIVEEEDHVTLVDGRGACPSEESNGLEGKGCDSYREFLDEYKRNPKRPKMKKVVKEATDP